MKEQLTDGWTRRLETTKDAEVSRAGKARRSYTSRPGEARKGAVAAPRCGVCVCLYTGLTKY